MATAFVKATTGGNTSTTDLSVAITNTAGNALVVGIHSVFLTSGDPGVTSTNNTFTKIDNDHQAFSNIWAYYALNVAGTSDTIHITNASAKDFAVAVLEYSGVATTSALGGTAKGAITSGATGVDIVTGSLSAGGATDDALIAVAGNYYAPTWVVGSTNVSGFAIEATATKALGNTFANLTAGDKILTGSYSGATSFNPTGQTYGNVVAFVLTAAAGGGGGGGGVPMLTLLGVG